MRQKYKEDFLVLNDLFIRTCRVVEHVPALARDMREVLGAKTDMDAIADIYDLGNNEFASSPTYKLHQKNFSQFVGELKSFARKTKELNADIESLMKNPNIGHRARLERELGVRARHDNEWLMLEKKYEAALRVLVKVDTPSLGEIHPVPYVNMLLCPREGAQLALFNRFVQAYLKIKGFDVKGTPGMKSGTSMDAWRIQDAYNWLLPLTGKIVNDFRVQRDRGSNLSAAVKAIKQHNAGLPRGSWKRIEPYLRGNRRHSAKKLALEILSYCSGRSSRSLERYVYMKR